MERMISREEFRTMIRNSIPTPLNQLRTLEKELTKENFSTLKELTCWLYRRGFYSLGILGDPLHCDRQFFKEFGQGRWHLRVYDYLEKLVIISEIDLVDPLGFTDANELPARTLLHWLIDGVLIVPTKHYIHFWKIFFR